MSIQFSKCRLVCFVCATVLTLLTSLANAQGIYLGAGGPIHRSMGGASTAAPTSALSALYWNPATISAFDHSETEVGLDLLFINHSVSSSFGGPTGSTDGVVGTFPIPNVGWVAQTPNPDITFGLGINSVAGVKTNLPADPSNPILHPDALGRVSSEAAFLQIAPVISVNLTERLAVAAGPIVTTGQIGLEPFVFDSTNADGSYPSGQASRYHWGGGFQVGVYYEQDDDWNYGASLKSPIWMERFEFFGENEKRFPRVMHADIDLPMVISLGTSYTGLEDWLFALDTRFFDYAHTDGFGDSAVFDATGKLDGLDFSSVFAVAFGVQRTLSDLLTVRAGYSFNQSPTRNSEAFYCIASPLYYQHIINTGATINLSENMALSASYSYYLKSSRTGPIVLPTGPIDGSSLRNELDVHVLSIGFTMKI